jgi:hypothetical protein
MLRVIRRLLAVIIWAVALFLAVAFFVVAPDASGNGPLVVRILAIGILLVAYVLNKIVNWVFADTE